MEGDPVEIRLPVCSLEALLDASGSPVLRAHLHPDAAEFLYDEAAGFPPKNGYRVTVEAPEDPVRTREVEQAIRSHFTSMAERTRRELRGEFRRGLKSLGFAALVVALLFLVQELLALSGDGRLHRMLAQSLIVISWVMLWIPLEALLFAPMNLRRRRKILEELGRAPVSVVRQEAGAGC